MAQLLGDGVGDLSLRVKDLGPDPQRIAVGVNLLAVVRDGAGDFPHQVLIADRQHGPLEGGPLSSSPGDILAALRLVELAPSLQVVHGVQQPAGDNRLRHFERTHLVALLHLPGDRIEQPFGNHQGAVGPAWGPLLLDTALWLKVRRIRHELVDKIHGLSSYPFGGGSGVLLSPDNIRDRLPAHLSQAVAVGIIPSADEGPFRDGHGRQKQKQEIEVIGLAFLSLLSPLAGLLGGHPQQIPIFGPDKEQVREVPGALVVALLADWDTQIFGLLCMDDGPILMDTGDSQYLAVSVALDTYLDTELLELFQLSLYPQQLRGHAVAQFHGSPPHVVAEGFHPRRPGLLVEGPGHVGDREGGKPLGPVHKDGVFLFRDTPDNGDDVGGQVGGLILCGVLRQDITGGEFDLQIAAGGPVVICQPVGVAPEGPAHVPIQYPDVATHREVIGAGVNKPPGHGVLHILNRADGVLPKDKLLSAGASVAVSIGGLSKVPPGDGLNPGRSGIDDANKVVFGGLVRLLLRDAQPLHGVLQCGHGIGGQGHGCLGHELASLQRGGGRLFALPLLLLLLGFLGGGPFALLYGPLQLILSRFCLRGVIYPCHSENLLCTLLYTALRGGVGLIPQHQGGGGGAGSRGAAGANDLDLNLDELLAAHQVKVEVHQGAAGGISIQGNGAVSVQGLVHGDELIGGGGIAPALGIALGHGQLNSQAGGGPSGSAHQDPQDSRQEAVTVNSVLAGIGSDLHVLNEFTLHGSFTSCFSGSKSLDVLDVDEALLVPGGDVNVHQGTGGRQVLLEGIVLNAVLVGPGAVQGGVGLQAQLLTHKQVGPVTEGQLSEAGAVGSDLIGHPVGEAQQLAAVHLIPVDVGAGGGFHIHEVAFQHGVEGPAELVVIHVLGQDLGADIHGEVGGDGTLSRGQVGVAQGLGVYVLNLLVGEHAEGLELAALAEHSAEVQAQLHPAGQVVGKHLVGREVGRHQQLAGLGDDSLQALGGQLNVAEGGLALGNLAALTAPGSTGPGGHLGDVQVAVCHGDLLSAQLKDDGLGVQQLHDVIQVNLRDEVTAAGGVGGGQGLELAGHIRIVVLLPGIEGGHIGVVAAKHVQALDGAGELDSGGHRLLGGRSPGAPAHVDAAVLPLHGSRGSLTARGRLGAGGPGGSLAALRLVLLHAFILLGFLILHAVIGLGFLLGLHNFAHGLQDLVGAHVAQLLASVLAGLALLGHYVHGLLNQGGDVSGGSLHSGVALLALALSLGLGLFLQGLLDASLDFLGQLVGLHLHRLTASRGGGVLGLGNVLAHSGVPPVKVRFRW
nr:MAG TPA: hypothetical protein [Caudoviricetes sp.]